MRPVSQLLREVLARVTAPRPAAALVKTAVTPRTPYIVVHSRKPYRNI